MGGKESRYNEHICQSLSTSALYRGSLNNKQDNFKMTLPTFATKNS